MTILTSAAGIPTHSNESEVERLHFLKKKNWWQGAVIYHVYPRSFLDTDGDGIGDLNGIEQKLEYVASLGVDAIWLSPFFSSPMNDFGYDVSDYLRVDPIFGNLEDFDALVDKAHRLDLKVIIDQVYSHTSTEHAWFKESRDNSKTNWYVWANAQPDGTPPNNWLSVFGGPAWTWDEQRKQYYLHNFFPSQPDLNLHNPAVQEALCDVARFWLNRGVDGLRLDAINYGMHDIQLRDNPPVVELHAYNRSHPNMPEFLEKLRTVLNEFGDVFTVAEVCGPAPASTMKSYTAGENRLHSAYSFDFLDTEILSAKTAKHILADWPNASGEGWPSWAFSNHDVPRVASRWGRSDKMNNDAKLYCLLLLCLRGNIFIYQGEELGLPLANVPFERLQDPEAVANWPDTLGRDGARTPIPWEDDAMNLGFSTAETTWLPIESNHAPLAANLQERDPNSVLNFFKKIIELRTQSAALRLGDLNLLDTPKDLLAFERTKDAERVLCVFNLGDIKMHWIPEHPEKYRVLSAVGATCQDAIPGTTKPFSGYIARRGQEA